MKSKTIASLALTVLLGAWAAAAPAPQTDKVPDRRRSAEEAAPAQESGSDTDFEQFGEESEKGREAAANPVYDPLRGFNWAMYHFNDKFYFWLGKPIARGYNILFPEPARVAISHGFTNMAFPVRFVSLALQGRFSKVGSETGRFLVNSTLGVGGLFDPADAWMGIRPTKADLGQTFGKWGIGDGFPLTLPFFGPSNLRDAIGMVPSTFLSPVTCMQYGGVISWEEGLGITVGGHSNDFSLHIGEYEKIKKDALDPYTFIRDAYKQNRDQRIKE